MTADDYLDDAFEDGKTVDRAEMTWWQRHKRQGHRVDWAFGGVPICYTCALIYPASGEEVRP